MDFYIIPPVKDIDLSSKGDRLFCLSHFYKQYPDYRKFFLEQRALKGSFITLDNSSAELSLVTEDVLIDIVRELQPDEVIAPDILYQSKPTKANLASFIARMKKENLLSETSIFGCPQGENIEAWLNVYDLMLTTPEVTTIGMSKIAIPFAFLKETGDKAIKKARHQAVDLLLATSRIRKPLHFLGMGEASEFRKYKKLNNPLFRSSDSCYSILAASKGIDFSKDSETRIETTEEYYHLKLTSEQRDLSLKNLEFLKGDKEYENI